MKIVITMAGDGTRFKREGIQTEKYRLTVRDQTMFEWAMQSLEAFFAEPFVFVTREEHESAEFIASKCDDLGIETFEIVELAERTSGQATTALAASDFVAPNESVAIYNIDTYVESQHLTPDKLTRDGCVPVFEAASGGWSYCEVGDDGRVTRVSEKEQISKFASLGLYYFDEWRNFEFAFEDRSGDVEDEYGERYIAPLYNSLIDDGKTVTVHSVPRSAVHVLGTPAEVCEFDPEFADRYDC